MYPKRDITAMVTKTTPAMIIPIIAPDVTLTPESIKGSGCASTANGHDKDKRDQKGEERSRTVDKPEKHTSSKAAKNEGQEGGDENDDPNGKAAAGVSGVIHHVIVENSLVC